MVPNNLINSIVLMDLNKSSQFSSDQGDSNLQIDGDARPMPGGLVEVDYISG